MQKYWGQKITLVYNLVILTQVRSNTHHNYDRLQTDSTPAKKFPVIMY